VTRTLAVYSPASGVLVEKMGDSLEGMKLTPGMTVFKLADLSTIWADVEVYEHQIKHLSIGQTVRIAVDAFPGRQWAGRITYFDPTIDPKTRTLRARVEIQNPDRALRPEMYANVNLQPPAANNVVRIPREVVLHTGERSVVIVQRGSGVFEPREVELGASGGEWQEVRSGIEAGETLVASSQFLIDSESNLREAINQMLAGSESEGASAPVHQH
jgi:RND family efflux transporter MFP subunit